MANVILIYANCVSYKAKGDFSLAGYIARDMALGLEQSHSNTRVVLTSIAEGVNQFHTLYGPSVGGMIRIDGIPIGLIALECFDGLEHNVVAFIDANRCNYASTELLKQVLAPDSKCLFVEAANRRPTAITDSIQAFETEQPDLYPYFNEMDVALFYSGLGLGRQGLPQLSKATGSGGASAKPYGFIYYLPMGVDDLRAIIQYMILAGYEHYELVGDMVLKKKDIEETYAASVPGTLVPQITGHASLDHLTMRNTIALAHGLVMTTGVMSTIEAMYDGRLAFYQYLENNEAFVESYLSAIKSICIEDKALPHHLAAMIIRMSELLFSPKPLAVKFERELTSLFVEERVSEHLVDMNKKLIDQANGKIASQLLTFIGQPSRSDPYHQRHVACLSLKRQDEKEAPMHTEALRRAAREGRVFELKVLLRTMTPLESSQGDHYEKQSALHIAVIRGHLTCARSLILHGVSLDSLDKDGHTPLDYATHYKKQNLVRLLVNAGVPQTMDMLKQSNP